MPLQNGFSAKPACCGKRTAADLQVEPDEAGRAIERAGNAILTEKGSALAASLPGEFSPTWATVILLSLAAPFPAVGPPAFFSDAARLRISYCNLKHINDTWDNGRIIAVVDAKPSFIFTSFSQRVARKPPPLRATP